MGIEEQLYRVPRYNRLNISLSDLLVIREVRELMDKYGVEQLTADDEQSKNVLRAALYMCGMNIDKHFEVTVQEHRSTFGIVAHCHFYLGIERTDQAWKDAQQRRLRA